MRKLVIPLAVILLLSAACEGEDEGKTSMATPVNLFPPVLGTPSSPAVPGSLSPISAPQSVWVGRTDGAGVYLRNTPSLNDRSRAYPDGTEMIWLGDETDADGHHWYKVRTPDSFIGWIPTDYLVQSPP